MEEETANSITHGIGFGLSLIAGGLLLTRAAESGNGWVMAGCGIYAASMMAVYAASTLSHVFREPSKRYLFRTLDQAFIYFLIVGTYTPFALTYLRGGWFWLLLGVMWTIAWLGFLSKTLLRHRINAVTTWSYVILGWLPIMAVGPIRRLAPENCLWWMLIGGLCYTIGVVFLIFDSRVRYFHSVWHLLVIAGSASHFWAIYHYVASAPVAAFS